MNILLKLGRLLSSIDRNQLEVVPVLVKLAPKLVLYLLQLVSDVTQILCNLYFGGWGH